MSDNIIYSNILTKISCIDGECPNDPFTLCCEGLCKPYINGWEKNGFGSVEECYASGLPGVPAICDAPYCP